MSHINHIVKYDLYIIVFLHCHRCILISNNSNNTRTKNEVQQYNIKYMSTSNICCSDNTENLCGNACDIAQTNLQPDCFKLRIEYDPSVPSYALSLCSSVVTFTNQCCMSGAGSIVLRIPMSFSQNCTLYRLDVPEVIQFAPTPNIFSVTVYDVLTNDLIAVLYVVENGYLNIIIPSNAISFGPVSTIMFGSFHIPVRKLSGLAPPNNPVLWSLGTTSIEILPTTTTTTPTTTTFPTTTSQPSG